MVNPVPYERMGVASTLLTNGMADIDQRVRIAALNWLDEQVGIHGDVLPRSILSQGFEFENQREKNYGTMLNNF